MRVEARAQKAAASPSGSLLPELAEVQTRANQSVYERFSPDLQVRLTSHSMPTATCRAHGAPSAQD